MTRGDSDSDRSDPRILVGDHNSWLALMMVDAVKNMERVSGEQRGLRVRSLS